MIDKFAVLEKPKTSNLLGGFCLNFIRLKSKRVQKNNSHIFSEIFIRPQKMIFQSRTNNKTFLYCRYRRWPRRMQGTTPVLQQMLRLIQLWFMSLKVTRNNSEENIFRKVLGGQSNQNFRRVLTCFREVLEVKIKTGEANGAAKFFEKNWRFFGCFYEIFGSFGDAFVKFSKFFWKIFWNFGRL